MMIDPFGRKISYLRLSVTDRCDLRCQYCMSGRMEFLPKQDILNFEEVLEIATTFKSLGLEKLRITGGEPLIRKDIFHLLAKLETLQIKHLALTTNGTHLKKFATQISDSALKSINISLDTLNEKRFKDITRVGKIDQVIAGIDAICSSGNKKLKLNTVIMKGKNEDEILDLVDFAMQREMDISFIEEMPLGFIDSHQRAQTFISSNEIKATIQEKYHLTPSAHQTHGPARYFQIDQHNAHIGFISPHSNNFCTSCNRVRLTANGKLLLCLGNEHALDTKQILRQPNYHRQQLITALHRAIRNKPEKHNFDLADEPQIVRFMNMTGG